MLSPYRPKPSANYGLGNYNKDGGGKYAEYDTPHAVAKIMPACLVTGEVSNVTCYDPSAVPTRRKATEAIQPSVKILTSIHTLLSHFGPLARRQRHETSYPSPFAPGTRESASRTERSVTAMKPLG